MQLEEGIEGGNGFAMFQVAELEELRKVRGRCRGEGAGKPEVAPRRSKVMGLGEETGLVAVSGGMCASNQVLR